MVVFQKTNKEIRFSKDMTTIRDILKAKPNSIDFGYIKDAMGQTVGWDIKLDLKSRVPPAKVFIHEVVHYLNPEMPENEVLKLESKLWKKLTHKEAKQIYRRIFK